MSATQTFMVTVTQPRRPALNGPAVTNGQFGFWINGDSGPDYTLQVSTNLMSWSAVATASSPVLPYFWVVTNSESVPLGFYRALLGP
jgi:hypothetical protein